MPSADTRWARRVPFAERLDSPPTPQAACVAHVAEHDLGAAAYAIKAAVAAAPPGHEADTRASECRWQRDRLPDEVRDLVLEDQHRRNAICWDVFDV